MPESFDSMLAEMADAAAAGLAPPDPAAVRRRARQRTLRRRSTVSALVLALLCGSGAGYAVLHQRTGRTEDVVGAPVPSAGSGGASPGPTLAAAAASASAAAAAAASPSGSGGSGGQAYSAIAGVWSAEPNQDTYVLVFPDGVVGLSQSDALTLCAGRIGTTLSASPTVTAAFGGGSSGATGIAGVANSTATASPTATPSASADSPASTAKTTALAPGTYGATTFALPLTQQPGCAAFGATTGLTLTDAGGSGELDLIGAGKAADAASGLKVPYSRVLDLSTAAAVDANGAAAQAMLKDFIGDWQSAAETKSGESGGLTIDAKGVVTYSYTATDGKPDAGSGVIDTFYAGGIRVQTSCAASTPDPACGVLLIEPGSASGLITVYTSTGAQTYRRVG